jgi:hypothetical protein
MTFHFAILPLPLIFPAIDPFVGSLAFELVVPEFAIVLLLDDFGLSMHDILYSIALDHLCQPPGETTTTVLLTVHIVAGIDS